MKNFLARLFNVEGDATLQVIDLIMFMGYFSVCLYAGGVAYQSSYNDAFNLQTESSISDPSLAVNFVTKVLLIDWYWIPSILYVLIFIFIFYACRYIWRPWFGYFLLSLLLYATFLVCGSIGKTIGNKDALTDMVEITTKKPVIKVYSDIIDESVFENGSYRFLSEDDKWLFIFEAQEIGSQIEVHAILKSNIQRYEVTIQ